MEDKRPEIEEHEPAELRKLKTAKIMSHAALSRDLKDKPLSIVNRKIQGIPLAGAVLKEGRATLLRQAGLTKQEI